MIMVDSSQMPGFPHSPGYQGSACLLAILASIVVISRLDSAASSSAIHHTENLIIRLQDEGENALIYHLLHEALEYAKLPSHHLFGDPFDTIETIKEQLGLSYNDPGAESNNDSGTALDPYRVLVYMEEATDTEIVWSNVSGNVDAIIAIITGGLYGSIGKAYFPQDIRGDGRHIAQKAKDDPEMLSGYQKPRSTPPPRPPVPRRLPGSTLRILDLSQQLSALEQQLLALSHQLPAPPLRPAIPNPVGLHQQASALSQHISTLSRQVSALQLTSTGNSQLAALGPPPSVQPHQAIKPDQWLS